MSTDIVKYAFIAGELSPTLYGRTDLTKFDLGMAEAHNFFVDYRGGLSSRPGTQFMEFIYEDTLNTRAVPFVFSPDEEDTYIMLFGDQYVRFLQSGYYVLEDVVACTVASGVVTAVAHGLVTGRWIKAGGRTYEVRNPTADTFDLFSVPDGVATTATFTSFQAIYEVATPYVHTDLDRLKFDQYRDRVRITHKDYTIRDLTRNDATDWVLSTVSISPYYLGPVITGESLSDAGTAQTIFAVAAVFADGTESIEGEPYRLDDAVNYLIEEGSVSIQWAPTPDAISYNIYRSVVAGGTTEQILSLGSELGYLGRTQGTKFTDPNIVPDFGRVPPRNYNPFSPGAITSVVITDPGTGYTSAPAVGMAGGGSGFVARAIINDAGEVVNVDVLNAGTGYTNPTVTFTGGGGADAAATATARATTGTNPALSAIFQQRQIFAASEENPITIWGSQPRRFQNFNSSNLVLDSDSFEFDLDTAAIAPIRHLLSTRGGLLAMTQDNVWIVNGGGSDNRPMTPTNALADPQTYTGVSILEPIRIGANILYTEGKGYAVRALSYNELARVYAGEDKSILSSHLFGKNKTIVRWAFQESPYKVVWCVRADGALLAYTSVEEEEVFAWTPCSTRGRFKDVVVVRESNEDRVYVTVERFINDRWTKFFERMDLRQFDFVEDAWCVDCGLALDATYPAGTVTIYRSGEVYTATITGGNWTSAVGKVLRAAGGLFNIASVNGTTATLTLRREPTDWVPETDEAYTFPAIEGNWTLDTGVTSITGLYHLEGETVSILADGNVIPPKVVTDGSVTLSQPATRVMIGLKFTCRAKTLPLIVPEAGIEAKRKRVVAVATRLFNSRGLKVGDSYDTVYEFPERTDEAYAEPTRLQNGVQQMPIGTTWDEESHTYFLLEDPLPVTLLSLVQDVEVGDDPD